MDRHGSTLPTTAQVVVEGKVHLEDAVVRTRVPVLDRLHYCNILQIVIGRGHPGHATPLGPIYGPGIYEGVPAKELIRYLRKARLFPLRPLCRDLASAPYKIL